MNLKQIFLTITHNVTVVLIGMIFLWCLTSNARADKWIHQPYFDTLLERAKETLEPMGIEPKDVFLDCNGIDRQRCINPDKWDGYTLEETLKNVEKSCSESAKIRQALRVLQSLIHVQYLSDTFYQRNFSNDYEIAKEELYSFADLVKTDLYNAPDSDYIGKWIHSDKTYQENYDIVTGFLTDMSRDCDRSRFYSFFRLSVCGVWCDISKLWPLEEEFVSAAQKYEFFSDNGKYGEIGYTDLVDYMRCNHAISPDKWNFRLKRSNIKDCKEPITESDEKSNRYNEVYKKLGL